MLWFIVSIVAVSPLISLNTLMCLSHYADRNGYILQISADIKHKLSLSMARLSLHSMAPCSLICELKGDPRLLYSCDPIYAISVLSGDPKPE